MKIDGKVYCFFEQSGTFKREFIKLGIPAVDYDIQNKFGETDCVIDLFVEIDKAYEGKSSVFDSINANDLIIAFYPCTYFCIMSQFAQSLNYCNYREMTELKAIDKIIERQKKRSEYLIRLTKFVRICVFRKLRMIFENPITGSFLSKFYLKSPTIIDNNRMLRGDYYKKRTGYWYWNCEPTYGRTVQYDKEKKLINHIRKNNKNERLDRSEERSIISEDYARNFICDFIIGKTQKMSEKTLFED